MASDLGASSVNIALPALIGDMRHLPFVAYDVELDMRAEGKFPRKGSPSSGNTFFDANTPASREQARHGDHH
jgi:hypothetical protein